MTAGAQVCEQDCPVLINPGILIFIGETAKTVKPHIKLGSQRPDFQILHAPDAGPAPISIDELTQVLAHQHRNLRGDTDPGIDVYVACPPNSQAPLIELIDKIDRATLQLSALEPTVRIHLFSAATAKQADFWQPILTALNGTTSLRGGGIYLFTGMFRDKTVDRMRATPILAQLMRTFALTGKSRASYDESSFSRLRSRDSYRICLTGIEAYISPPFAECAEQVFDSAVRAHLDPVISPTIRKAIDLLPPNGGFHPIDNIILAAAKNADTVEKLAANLSGDGVGTDNYSRLEIEMRRFIANARLETPLAAVPTHAFETVFRASQDHDIRRQADIWAGNLIERFPVPLHPYISACRDSPLTRHLVKMRQIALDSLTELLRKRFYRWTYGQHRSWLPDEFGFSASPASAISGDDAGTTRARVTCHLDPILSEDSREELLPGSETISFLHVVTLNRT